MTPSSNQVRPVLYRVEELNNSNVSDWEELNEKSVDGSFFHTLKWMRFLERFFRLRTRYYLMYQSERLVALFPFFEQRIKGFSGLVTLPYLTVNPCNHIVTIDQQSSLMEAIQDKCREITRENDLSFVVAGVRAAPNYFEKSDYYSQPTGNMLLNLSKNNLDKIVSFRIQTTQTPRRF